MAPNLSFGSGCSGWSSSKAHLPMWARFRARTGSPPGIRPVMRDDQRRAGRPHLGFLLPFGCRHWLLGHPVPPVELVHRYLRLTATRPGVADPDGVSVFRTHETRLGLGSGRTAALLRRSPLRTGLERFPFIRLKQARWARWRIAVPNHVRRC